jgi:hypothetical protein
LEADAVKKTNKAKRKAAAKPGTRAAPARKGKSSHALINCSVLDIGFGIARRRVVEEDITEEEEEAEDDG